MQYIFDSTLDLVVPADAIERAEAIWKRLAQGVLDFGMGGDGKSNCPGLRS